MVALVRLVCRAMNRSLIHPGLLILTVLLGCSACGSNSIATDPSRCEKDTDCPQGDTCDNGVCRHPCANVADCPQDWLCLSTGFCGENCEKDVDCGDKKMCEGGQCVDRPVDLDRDKDGLPNDIEDRNGNGIVDNGETDPDNPDSDADGLQDGVEDANHNGQQDNGETNPLDRDSDRDGLPDGVEDSNKNGTVDNGETDPRSSDSDGDGLPDGLEDTDRDGEIDAGETDPAKADTDGDALPDGIEDRNHNGKKDSWETDPTKADTDMDGLPDGIEDANHDGQRQPGETDPIVADTDGDALPDGIEDSNQNGVVDATETDPRNPDTDSDGIADGTEDVDHDGELDLGESDPRLLDTDADGLPDGIEDKNRNGVRDDGETDPLNADSDGDGLPDGVEDLNHNGQIDFGECDPLNEDTDGDNLLDGIEDANQNGIHDTGETKPTNPDTDGDGIPDGSEDANHNGIKDPTETDPNKADTDADGLSDGQEDCNHNFQTDPGVESDPLNPDTDGDGVIDGDEDRNGDCKVGNCTVACQGDPNCAQGEHCSQALGVCVGIDCADGETSPLTSDTDGDGQLDIEEGTHLVCSTDNLKPVDLHRGFVPDYVVALEAFFSAFSDLGSGGTPVGAVFYSPANQLAGFLVSHPPAAGVSDANAQEAHDRALLSGLGTVTSPSTRTLTTFDGYKAVLGEYTLTVTSRVPTELAQNIAEALQGGGALTGALADQGASGTVFHLFTETIYRDPGRVVTVGALSTQALFNADQIIRMNDVGNSTAVAQAPDRTRSQCDSFSSVGNNPVDFIWVVDNSNSMAEEQAAIRAAGDAMKTLLAQTTLDWRIAVTLTSNNGALLAPGFTTDIERFKTLIQAGVGGSGSEFGLLNGLNAVNSALPCTASPNPPNAYKFRCDATRIVVVLSDEDDQTIENASGGDNYCDRGLSPNAATVNSFINLYRNKEANLFVIAGGSPMCPTAYNSSCGYNAVVAGIPGALSMSICDANQTANVENIVRSAHGVASVYNLTKPPISSTLKVALQVTAGQPAVLVPRSRTDGFDYDGTQNSLVFYGSYRPGANQLDVAVSYRSFEKCIPAPEVCDGIDNDCNGEIDEIDADGDGSGLCSGDCDDSNADIHPGATEICNDKDDNCNGFVDEGFDLDNDGWTTCEGDCDDSDPNVHPGATERCNGIDDNCDGSIDEGFDQDGDGVTTCAGDCDDTNDMIYPGAEETCDCIDNNCNGQVDEGFDLDGDGWTTCGDCNLLYDCDDNDDTIYPGAPERCDGKDNDCDGEIDPDWACG